MEVLLFELAFFLSRFVNIEEIYNESNHFNKSWPEVAYEDLRDVHLKNRTLLLVSILRYINIFFYLINPTILVMNSPK